MLLLITGCATQNNLYHWGNYEALIYANYASMGQSPDVQIQQITTDIEQAKTEGKATPPGIYAHLGMLYLVVDKKELALTAFTQEKLLYPESTVFIDGIINRGLQGTGNE